MFPIFRIAEGICCFPACAAEPGAEVHVLVLEQVREDPAACHEPSLPLEDLQEC